MLYNNVDMLGKCIVNIREDRDLGKTRDDNLLQIQEFH